MSSLSKSSLDNDWELATARTSSSRDRTVSSDDEELDSLGDDDDQVQSELGDEWEGIDTESHSESQEIIDYPQTTPLQPQRVLSADADNAQADLSASAESSSGPSENSGTDSTFSFHFPDPLEASREYAEAALPHVDGDLSDADTNSIVESDAVGLSMSIGALERSATLVVPPLARSRSVTPVAATASISPRFPFTAYVSYPLFWLKSGKRLMNVLFDSRVALTALVIACIALPGVYQGMLSRSHEPAQSLIPTITESSYDYSTSLAPVTSLPPAPLIEETTEETVVQFSTATLETPSSVESLSAPSVLPTHDDQASAVASTYMSFSNLILRDLHDVLQIIDELLLFIRSRTIANVKRSLLEYVALVLADRHERAKNNARKLWSRARGGIA